MQFIWQCIASCGKYECLFIDFSPNRIIALQVLICWSCTLCNVKSFSMASEKITHRKDHLTHLYLLRILYHCFLSNWMDVEKLYTFRFFRARIINNTLSRNSFFQGDLSQLIHWRTQYGTHVADVTEAAIRCRNYSNLLKCTGKIGCECIKCCTCNVICTTAQGVSPPSSPSRRFV